MRIRPLGILGLSLFVSFSVHAGQKLLLKTGAIDTTALSVSNVLQSRSINSTAYFIVQFKSAITLDDQEWLTKNGIKVLRYVPQDAYIVKLSENLQLAKIQRLPQVQTLIPYQPEFRMDGQAMALSVFNGDHIQKVLVRRFSLASSDQFLQQLRQLAITEDIEVQGETYLVDVKSHQVPQLANIEGVEWVEIYSPPKLQTLQINDFIEDPVLRESLFSRSSEGRITDLTGLETGTSVMKFNSAWRRGLTGRGQIAAVADTGLDTGEVRTLSGDFSNLVRPYVAGIHSRSWGDPDGHGTHVAGSVVNSGRNSQGHIVGGAYDAGLVMESLYSARYKTITPGADPRPLFEAAYRDGARVHSNSWGSMVNLGAYTMSAQAVDSFVYDNPDMLILFAAGNSGADLDQDGRVDSGSVASPSTAKNVLSVGASENYVESGGIQVPLGLAGSEETGFMWPVEPLASDRFSNNINGVAAFSSRGPTQDGRLKPDVVAPGTNILSACSQHKDAGKLWGPFNKNYCYSGGTSMSTPLVAAAAILVRQNLIEKRRMPQPSAALVKAVLMHTAVDMYPGQFGEIGKERGQELLTPGPNVDQGYGRVDVDQATGQQFELVDEKLGLATGESKSYAIPSGTRKVTLVYTDAPGATAAQQVLVNNLDIEVHTTSGRFFTSNSEVNNSEQVVLPSTREGLKLIVKAKSVPMGRGGRQGYAVVYSH